MSDDCNDGGDDYGESGNGGDDYGDDHGDSTDYGGTVMAMMYR